MKNPYVLPKEVLPVKYNLEIIPDFKKLTFKGFEEIEINVLKATKKITLNSKNLEITSCSVHQPDHLQAKVKYNKKFETVTFFFNKLIKKGKAVLKIKFKGNVRNDMRGFYKSTYYKDGKEKFLLTTQFEPADARGAFPCFDEPELKAKFNLSFVIPKDLTAISNMQIKKEEISKSAKKIIFHETPIMSTYLVAFVIGELEYIQKRAKDGTLIRVYTTVGKKEQGKFALDITIKILNFYNDYFKIPYPLQKLDLIAIPDFESGAMENWGLITYRETRLLFDEKYSSLDTKQDIALVIAHEIAHQWFGNLVTMKWWSDLWLNEGFASWMEYKAVNEMFPEWDLWIQFFTDEIVGAFSLDSLASSHPIEVKVENPNQVDEIFDAISYNKGSAVIRMLEQYLGENVFRDGLRYYLNRFRYGNAVTEDLWNSLAKISGKPVKKIMDSWTKQTGYPIISVKYRGNKILLSQERFLFLKKQQSKTLWHIPVSVKQGDNIKYYIMNKRMMTINAKKPIINSNQEGFYRVMYDDVLFKEIFSLLKKRKLSNLEKITIQNNLYAICRANYRSIRDYLELVKNYKNETYYVIWDDLSSNLARLLFLFYNKKFIKKLKEFNIELFSKIYKRVGWKEKKNEKHIDVLLRTTVLSMLGICDHKEVLNQGNKLFKNYLKTKDLSPNLRGLVYSIAAYTGDKKTFDILLKLYRKEKLPEEKNRLLVALGTFKQKNLLERALKFSLTDEVRLQDKLILIGSVAGNVHGKDLVWKFFKDNFNKLMRMYSGTAHLISGLVKIVTLRFYTKEKLKEVRAFFKKHPIEKANMAIKQGLEAIKINYNFVRRHEKDLEEYFK